MRRSAILAGFVHFALFTGHPLPGSGQVPTAWGTGEVDLHTFSIVAVDAVTGEVGVAVTTRVPCVGSVVPWVRAGVGAVATQALTRPEYGRELLDLIEAGVAPVEALRRATARDPGAASRQIAVVSRDGRIAQHTGRETNPWSGHRAGAFYAAQGNLLVGPEVVDAVAATFEASAGTGRALADRMIEALSAGAEAGGDRRSGRPQSAAVLVADPRPGRSRRPDGETVRIDLCEHPDPVRELRRVYDTTTEVLGFRTLERSAGDDVWQLKVILHELGYGLPDPSGLRGDPRGEDYDERTVAAVEAFRERHGLSTARSGSPSGLVDAALVELLWKELERAGRAAVVRARILGPPGTR